MSVKTRLLTAGMAMTMAGGLALAATPAASAETAGCGPNCIDLYANAYGPGFIPAVAGQVQNAGQPVLLAPASTSNPGEDFTASAEGLVSDFIAAGLVSPGLSGYDSDVAVEFGYAPGGAGTDLCLGVGATPGNGTPVGLEPCGVSAKTVWILNFTQTSANSITGSLISAATESSFSHPYTLTDLKPGGNRQLFTAPLGAGGIVHNKLANQQWTIVIPGCDVCSASSPR